MDAEAILNSAKKTAIYLCAPHQCLQNVILSVFESYDLLPFFYIWILEDDRRVVMQKV